MSRFSRKRIRARGIPEPYLRGLRNYGEHLVGLPGAHWSTLLTDLEMLDYARQAPDSFAEMLTAAIAGGPAHIRDNSGACQLGAAEIATQVYEIDVDTPAWHAIVDGAIDYLRSCGVPYSETKPYLRVRWEQSHPPAEWSAPGGS